jgi:hypothetical protein
VLISVLAERVIKLTGSRSKLVFRRCRTTIRCSAARISALAQMVIHETADRISLSNGIDIGVRLPPSAVSGRNLHRGCL